MIMKLMMRFGRVIKMNTNIITVAKSDPSEEDLRYEIRKEVFDYTHQFAGYGSMSQTVSDDVLISAAHGKAKKLVADVNKNTSFNIKAHEAFHIAIEAAAMIAHATRKRRLRRSMIEKLSQELMETLADNDFENKTLLRQSAVRYSENLAKLAAEGFKDTGHFEIRVNRILEVLEQILGGDNNLSPIHMRQVELALALSSAMLVNY